MTTFRLVFFVAGLNLAWSWDTTFKFNKCYNTPMEERMPLSIDNLIAIIEGYERKEMNSAPEDIAEAILHRYRKNGVIFNPKATVKWSVFQDEESTKQDLDNKLLKPFKVIPENSFSPREECSLHLMLSHSIDNFPHPGVDYVWENELHRKKRQSNWGNSRSSDSNSNWGLSSNQDYGSNQGFGSNQGYSSNQGYEGNQGYNGNDGYSSNNQGYSNSQSYSYPSSSAHLPDGMEPSKHPIEFGVIQTPAGPVSAGLLLAGIFGMASSGAYSVEQLIGSETSKDTIPPEMMSPKIEVLLGATLSGKLGQSALLWGMRNGKSFQPGPIGTFSNCTGCARLYSLKTPYIDLLTRAEIFGALDGLIIAEYLRQKGSSQSITLSQILRMYYSNHGLLNSEIRACNRKNIFRKFQQNYKDRIYDQALNYMYAYQDYFPEINAIVQQDQDNFHEIESAFSFYLRTIIDAFTSFMNSYSYDDPGFHECPREMPDTVLSETQVDLVVVYSPVGSNYDMEKQTQYIALTARYLGVGYDRSRIAVLNGRKNEWLSPMMNHSNIADYACNYTTFLDFSGGTSQNLVEVMESLMELYGQYYMQIRSDPDQTGKNSQVVLWNLPENFDGDENEMVETWDIFNLTYPDVTFIFVGQGVRPSQLAPFYNDERDNEDELILVDNSPQDPEEIAQNLVREIQKAPRMFVYPACDTFNKDSEDFTNEGSHIYKTYVSPNFTTYIKIPPQNFLYSENLALKFKDTDVYICVSRQSKRPSSTDGDIAQCDEAGNFVYEAEYLCDNVWETCDPIYISVKGNPDSTRTCNVDDCQFPNQIEFEMTHEGMSCGVGYLNLAPTLLLTLLLITILQS